MTVKEYLDLAKEFGFGIYKSNAKGKTYTPEEYEAYMNSRTMNNYNDCESDIMLPQSYNPTGISHLALCGYRYTSSSDRYNDVLWNNNSVLFYPLNFDYVNPYFYMKYDTTTDVKVAREIIFKRIDYLNQVKKFIRKQKIEEL